MAKNTTSKKLTKSERKEALMRILVLLITGIVLYLWGYLVLILTIINWFIVIFSGKRNKDIANFSAIWASEIYRFVSYLTFETNERPFPFSSLSKI